MKIDWNKRYTTIAVYAFLTVAACICFYAVVQWFPFIMVWIGKLLGVLSPFIYGFVIAYLINPVQREFAKLTEKLIIKVKKFRAEKKLAAKKRIAHSTKGTVKEPAKREFTASKKVVKALSIIESYLVLLIVISIFITILVPQVAESLTDIRSNFENYSNQAIDFLQSAANVIEKYTNVNIFSDIIGETFENLEDLLLKAKDLFNKYYPSILGFLESLVLEFKNFFIGLLISVYMLTGRERFKAHAKKILSALLPDNVLSKTYEIITEADRCFGGFIVAKLIDSTIIGVLCFVCMTLFGFPYPFLISLIVGVTNIIPFFGPFIGGIPSGIIIFLTKPSMTILFVILIIVIQQLDGNIIGPKIIGQTIGLSSFWVLFSLILMGGFFGITGMIIAVPLFSLLYNESKNIVEALLRKKGKPDSTDAYYD